MSPKAQTTYKLATVVIAVASLLPLLLVLGEMWDGDEVALGHMIQDFERIGLVKLEGWHINYWLRVIVNEIALFTGIPHKVFTNVMTVAAVLGIAKEAFKYLRNRFDISEKGAYWGAWVVLAFPVWHTLVTSINSYYALYLWLFMIAVNHYLNGRKWLSLAFFVPSLQYFSLFAFAVGVACTEFIMTVNRDNYKSKALKVIGFSAVLLAIFITLKYSITMHRATGTYNTFTLKEWPSLVYYAGMSVIVLAAWGVMHRFLQKLDSPRMLRLLLSFLCLAFFAALAYWAVGRPLRYFAFGSFTSRHTYLTCIPFALIVGTVYDICAEYFREKRIAIGFGFLALTLVVLQYQGYDHKVAALLFKDMLTVSFAEQEPPESGYVGIFPVDYKPPRHVHLHSINLCMFKAYGKAAWMANGFWQRHIVPTREALEKIYPKDSYGRHRAIAFDVTGDAYTKYTFKLNDYHQEGRLWYWYSYLFKDYRYFNPTLTKES